MKVYSIGREAGCDIVINDSTDVISRRHAVLTVTGSGKMTITDSSHNGTYVNGIRIAQNVAVPVTRKDNISFAHVARLDWNLVPKPVTPIKYIIIAVVAIVVIVGGIVLYKNIGGASTPTEKSPTTAVADSDTTKQADKDKTDAKTKKADKPAQKQKKKKKETKAKDQSKTKDKPAQKAAETKKPEPKKPETKKPEAPKGNSRADR